MDQWECRDNDGCGGGVRLPSTACLVAFEAAVRLQSYERASEELVLSASAVGKRIAALEEQLGVRLLIRSGRTVTPTIAGQEYLCQVHKALGLLRRVPLHKREGRARYRLTVCTPPTFARLIMVPALAEFQQLYPDVSVEVELSGPHGGSRAPGADVEVVAGALETGADAILCQEPIRAFCHPARQREWGLERPKDLRHAPLVRCPLEPWAPWFAAAGLDWSEPRYGLRLLDSGLNLEAAAHGLGVVLGRLSQAKHLMTAGALIMPFGVSVPPATQYGLVCKNRKAAGSVAVAFCDWLRGVSEQATRGDASFVAQASAPPEQRLHAVAASRRNRGRHGPASRDTN